MKLTAKTVAPIVLIIIGGGIGLSAALNMWHTESDKIPATYSAGEFAGEYDPADIRGSYTFADVEASFGVAAEVIAKAFGLDYGDDPSGLKVKDLETVYGEVEEGEIGTDSVRYFVSLYTGRPYEPEEDSLLPSPALQFLADRLSAERLSEVRARSISLSQIREPDVAPADHEESSTEAIVKGKTTFADLESWGLTKEEIETAIGMQAGKSGVTVRDHVVSAGLEFSLAKTALQQLIDSKR